ncbi:MAG TPA: hypothetical protein PLZ79_09070 [Burkholderiales bacterium]|nr:hypothetical protein [Burkholderiaceae bacterium]HQR53411.1 hypothetical protein [Burkholderiales bacterium]
MTHTAHRALQLSTWIERALYERIRCRNAARKASEIGNKGALGYFHARAVKWDNILARASAALGRAALARVDKATT